MRHVTTKTLEYYVPEVGRKVNLWGLVPTSEEFFEDIQQASLKVAKMYLEAGLEEQRDALIGADRHGRAEGRKDHRNGYYLRKHFQTAIGRIRGMKIPRCRKQFARIYARRNREIQRQAESGGLAVRHVDKGDVAAAFYDAAREGVSWKSALLVIGTEYLMLDIDNQPLPWARQWLPECRKAHRRGLKRAAENRARASWEQ